jgi:hypothetical protein
VKKNKAQYFVATTTKANDEKKNLEKGYIYITRVRQFGRIEKRSRIHELIVFLLCKMQVFDEFKWI